ncbi:DUF4241 domain-containing protein [Aliidiomarina soli]|uniref:DUF4241 domain-containing protein n=1 Tax=Aliidiomarina soli TaxID=1928574 RepID=A0A432WM62_9GAMM|nr:DUF4241 domain-containing protein [Aliidiomarina soli]RUO34848.1 hypothetical protein CWE14_02295 [Aliidiomarina soli]
MKYLNNIFGKKSCYGEPVKTPAERVTSYISHWHQQWSKAEIKSKQEEDNGEGFDFGYWHDLLSDVNKAHFAEGSTSGSENVFGSTPEHDPDNEKIIECEIEGDLAHVFTALYEDKPKPSKYHAYELHSDADKGWKIKQILTLFDPPKTPVIAPEQHAEILAMASVDAPFKASEDNLALNEHTLFQQDRRVKTPYLDEAEAKLEEVGKLKITSGVLGILDFGYDIYRFEPLQRKVKPGSYLVETVTTHNRVAGIRVKLSDSEQAVKWYAANTPSGNGVYGVDAGNLAIFDVGNLLELSHLKKEKLFDRWSVAGKPELLSMTGQDDCVISTSGFGDGAYPAFWGVNDQDEVVSLYIDFMILVQENEQGLLESI